MSTVTLLTNQPANQPTKQPCSQVTNQLTNSLLEQSPPSEANSSSANQEIPCILRNVMVQYSIHMNLLPVHVLSQNNPVHDPDPIPADAF
jgi:hypothetical protein